ncbi:MAG: HPr(Ser) kinase/phosphatase [Granulosicoccus sp.]|nr:HPr(Ser) kinase/phosphatase [Granulosicoccus sp.]
MENLTVQRVFDTMCQGLDIEWVAGCDGGHRLLSRQTSAASRPSLIGPLNANNPNRVQVLGRAEIALIASYAHHELDMALSQSDLIIVTDGLRLPEHLNRWADTSVTPLFVAQSSYNDCLNTLRHRLTQALADRAVLHGVLMDVLGTGVLLIGASGVGKSELALELVSRGHILVADDAPEFSRIAPETLEGRCPPLLQDFLEVRGLGILNIARMYGDAHTRRRKILKFIIELRTMKTEELNDSISRDTELYQERDILGVTIRQRTLPVAPGRNLAVLVEAAVRNHILTSTGYNATDDLIQKQSLQLSSGE